MASGLCDISITPLKTQTIYSFPSPSLECWLICLSLDAHKVPGMTPASYPLHHFQCQKAERWGQVQKWFGH